MSTPETLPVKKSSRIRKWVTPLTMGAFLLTAATGLGLFFEVEGGFVKPIHEWFSLTLVLGGALHVFDHWKGIRNHLSSPWGKAFVAAGVAMLVVAVLPAPERTPWPSMAKMNDALGRATVAEVARLGNVPADSVLAGLKAGGCRPGTMQDTVAALCRDGKDGVRAGLAKVFVYRDEH